MFATEPLSHQCLLVILEERHQFIHICLVVVIVQCRADGVTTAVGADAVGGHNIVVQLPISREVDVHENGAVFLIACFRAPKY